MKVGIEREKLEKEIRKGIYELNLDGNLVDKAVDMMVKKGYKLGEANQMMTGNSTLEFLTLIDIGVMTHVLFKVLDIEKLNPEKYFNPTEVDNIMSYEIKSSSDNEFIDYPVVFRDMIQQSHDQWVGIISIQNVVQLLNARKIRYNYKTQRNPLFVKHKDSVIQRPNINTKSVKEIADKIVKKEFIPDTLTFNILRDGEEDFKYNAKHRTITLNEGSLDMLDGMHRSLGATNALLQEPNIELYFGLLITNFDVDKATRYILQKDLRNPLDTEYKTSIDVRDLTTSVVRNINSNMQSDMRGLIVTDNTLIDTHHGLTMFSTMKKTIEKLWSIKTRKEVNDLSEYLIEFFNELIGLKPELKTDIKKTRTGTHLGHPNMFVFYLTIANEIQGEKEWKKTLEHIISTVEFEKDNDFWYNRVTGLYSRNFNRKINEIIKDYRAIIKG